MQLDSYDNEREKDCVEASLGNAVNIITGRFTPNASVQQLYRATGHSIFWRMFWARWVAGWTGLRMWEFYLTGLNGYRPRSFGKIAPTAPALRAALIRYRAIIVGYGGGHQVCLYAQGLRFFVADSVNGIVPAPDLAALAKTLDSNSFAFSDRFDLALILTGMRNNWRVWAADSVLLAIIAAIVWRSI